MYVDGYQELNSLPLGPMMKQYYSYNISIDLHPFGKEMIWVFSRSDTIVTCKDGR